MDKIPGGEQKSFPGQLGSVLCMWFLAGMLLSMFLSGVYSLIGVPLPPLFFFLSALIYLTGGLLGGMWSRGSLRRRDLFGADLLVALFLLIVSLGFLILGIIFVAIGLRRL